MESTADPARAGGRAANILTIQAGKRAFLKQNVALLAFWPILCFIVGALLWLTIQSQLQTDRNALCKDALNDAAALSRAYARDLTRSIEQVDQATLLIQYRWQQSHRAMPLEQLLQDGLFTGSRFAVVTIIDRNGVPLSGTSASASPAALTGLDHFQFHRNETSHRLHIGEPPAGRVFGKAVVQFSRRLEMPDGSFDGVVLIAVQPEYFASFYDAASLGRTGLLAFAGSDGELRMARIGAGGNSMAAPALRALPALDGGPMLRDANWFGDHQPRFVASQKLPGYPLVAIVGLSEQERLAPYRDSKELYRNLSLTGAALLFAFACLATLLSARLAWRRHEEQEVQEAYRVASEGGHDGFYMLRTVCDKSGAVVDFEVADCNARGAAFSGESAEDFVGKRLSELYPKPYFYAVLDTFRAALESGFYEDDLKIPSESPVKLEWVHRRLVRSGAGLAMTMRDITESKAHERELSRMANEDALTALPNRNWLMHLLPAELVRIRNKGGMLALLFVDLDNFKDVNDSLGHSTGDELLQQAARRLQAVLRPSDSVVRLGGDEFTVIIEPIDNESDAAVAAERIAAALDLPFDLAHGRNSVAASIGISLFPRDGEDTETLLKNSDLAMYHAKAAGKGQYRFYEASMSERLRHRLDNERALQQAIEKNEFVLFYQPRVDTCSGQLRGLEALVRWQHPQRGLVMPSEFIGLAEETGLILKLGELVLHQACAQIAHWRSLNLPLVPVSINVSPRQFSNGDIHQLFAASLTHYRLAPELVEIEITESSMMGEEAELAAELSAIRKFGIKLLVDDFGTGYSSLSQLQRLDMDVLKVDRAFTSALGQTSEAEVFFRAMVSMAHALSMSVVAEGVETIEQLRILQALRCDEVQGYYIARPMPAEQAAAVLVQGMLLPSNAIAIRA